MSIKYMTKVWQMDDLTANQKLVFLAICDNANDEGICYPSLDTIQKKTSLARATVIKIINFLVSNNYLNKAQRARKGGGRYSSLYLVFPAETLENLDEEYKEKFLSKQSQSSTVELSSQSSTVELKKQSQSSTVELEPLVSLYNHHLFNSLNNTQKELYLEYIKLRKKLKLITTIKIHERLLTKFKEFGSKDEIIQNAITANWKDFYPINQNNSKAKEKAEYLKRCTKEKEIDYSQPINPRIPF